MKTRSLLRIFLAFGIFFLISHLKLIGQNFVTSAQCQECHPEHFENWAASGHPYKFTVIENDQPPVYPAEAINFQSEWMDSLGDGSHTWADVAGVIGGYGWKARFVGTDGHIIGSGGSSFADAGGGHNQINFFGGENHGWVDYEASNQNKIYNYGCFKCHTTGGDTTGTWLAGVDGLGTFSEEGIGCESCHGPGSDHIINPTKANIDLVYEYAHLDNGLGGLSVKGDVQMPDPEGNDVNFLCGTCHNRSYTSPINSSGGFIRHHEQWDEFVATKHSSIGFDCIICHDPHKRTIWDGEGITRTCESCHIQQAAKMNHSPGITCIDCHMPFAAKSGTKIGQSGFRADVRSHLIAIKVDTASMFTADGSAVKDDEERSAALSLGFACLGCHNDDPNDAIPDKTIENAMIAAANMHADSTAVAEYVTSQACQICHEDHYDTWAASGHPYKFSIIENEQPPVYPPEAVNFQSEWMDSLGDGSHTWADVAGVIGGYGWKARFVGTDGHIIGTAGSSFADAGGGHNQINFYGGENHGWVDYDINDQKIYNYSCFKCHTTGGDTTGTWLAGVDGLGTFSEGGIGCESCHGPGSMHIGGPTKQNIDKVYESSHLDNSIGGLSVDGEVQLPNPEGNDVNFLCGTCHNRSYTSPINSSGGFIRHHEQWDEFVATKHGDLGLTCITCHDPHKRTIWDGEGITRTCESCHPNQAATMNHAPGLSCIDCHMPYAAKSGTKIGQSGFRADVRSHLVAIKVDTASMFTEDGSAVKDDEERSAALSPNFACLGCHNDDPNDAIPDQTLEAAIMAAGGMHITTGIRDVLVENAAVDVYPNPATDRVTISYTLYKSADTNLKIFNTQGQIVYADRNTLKPAGLYTLQWDGTNTSGTQLPAGIYYIQVNSAAKSYMKKLMLIK